MKVKKLFSIILLTLIISEQSLSREYYCKIIRTIPSLDLNQLPIKEGVIDIDFEKRIVNYWQKFDIQIYNLKFENDLASWLHTYTNPVSGKKRITYSYFNRSKKEFIQNTFPNKKNIKSEDLVLRMEFKCN
ncbi:hypothetical protein N8910_05170 [Candidatus Pelagibacter ubique]|nr:hypothetical protein [Candidatus Pelagibacter ubique]